MPKLSLNADNQKKLPVTDASDRAFRRLVTETIRRCPKKRAQVADELTMILGSRVTAHMLNSFTSDAKRAFRFPGFFIRPFCEITGDDALQRQVLSPRLLRLLELGEAAAEALDDRAQRSLLARGDRKSRCGKRGQR